MTDEAGIRCRISLALAALALLTACATTPVAAPVSPREAPLVDYHQHLVSPAFAPIVKLPERDGAALVRELNAAGIERAVVLSVGYSFADERKKLDDPDRLTREQNDWTSAEVVRHAPRLIGFCSANPLREVALQELERCLGFPGMTGITPADATLVAQRIRQVGPGRVLYGSALSPPGGSIRRGWEIFRTKVPLTAEELQQIAYNRTRFAR